MVNKTNVPDAEDWKRTLDALPDLICTLDTEHKVLWMNTAMAKKLGVTQTDAKGLTCYKAVHGTASPPDFCPHSQLLLDQQEHMVEVHEERLGGDFLVTCTPLTDKDGELVGSIHVARDMTGRERLLSDILNQAKEGFGCFRPDGTLTEVNEALCRMLGYERSELLKFKATDLIANEDPEITASRMKRIVSGANEIFESAHLTKDGRVVPTELSLSYSPVHDLFFFFIRDITERKQAEERLRKELDWFEHILRITKTGFDIIDDEFNLQFVDKGWQERYGDPTGRKCYEYFNGLINPCPGCGIPKALETKKNIVTEEVLTLENNRIVEVHTIPFQDKDGRWLVAEFNLDITERKQAEETLRRNEKDLRESQRIAHVGSWRLDVATNEVFWTEELYNMYGFDPSLPPPPYTEHMKLFTPESWERLSTALARTRDTGIPYTLELETVRKDGSNGWMWVRGEVDVDSAGKTVGLWGAAQDITGRKRAEEKLRENETLLNEVGQIAKIGGWEMDLITRKARWTRGTYDIVEIEPDQPPPGPDEHVSYYLPEYRPAIDEAMRALIEEDKPLNFEARLRTAKGNIKWCHAIGRAVRKDGKCLAVHGTFQDITERKLAVEALRISEANLQAIMTNTTDVIASYDREVRLVVFNKACAEIYRRLFNVELYPGLCTIDLFPEADREFWREKNARALGGESFSFEFELTFPDRCKLVFESTMHPIRQGDEVVGFTTTTRDITERKRSEEALRTSEARYRQAQAIGHVGNWEYNIQTTQFWGSDEAKRIYGFDPAQSNFSTDKVEKCIPERERVHQALVDLIEANKPYNLEFEIIPINSSESRIITSIAELEHDEHGNPLRVVGVIQDITERKRIEEEKEKLQTQLFQSQKMESVGRLAGGVAHDFNNMLQAILGHAELALLKVGPDETLYADLKEIQKAAQRSADLTRQLLAFARKQTVAPRVLDLNETVEGMLKMLRRLIGEDIDLAWMPGSNIGPVFIDPSQMDQILANLCVNARDAITGTGKIIIETDSVFFDEAYCADHDGFIPGEFVMLAVSDDGCGMDAGTLSHLFEPFFTTKDIGKGTGLGLATVYGAVRQNKGIINVYSEPGHGTTFKIYLPLYAARATTGLEQERDPAPAAGGETILLVEDEPAILKMTTLMLESMGYTVIVAATPGEAIRLAREHTGRIDLLMTDVVMPEMNGRELAVNLMSIYPDIRRLFMSGYTANVIAHQGVLDQGVHFIQKPFSMQGLSTKIREALNRE